MNPQNLSDFDYTLPRELIAQYPVSERELSRMLVLDRSTGDISHKCFKDLPCYFKKNDILALNNTKVVNARLAGKKPTGGRAELLLVEKLADNRFKALIKPSARIKEGDEIRFDDPDLKACILTKKAGDNLIEFSVASGDIGKKLDAAGEMPLPPYIKRGIEASDTERYQTWALGSGSLRLLV